MESSSLCYYSRPTSPYIMEKLVFQHKFFYLFVDIISEAMPEVVCVSEEDCHLQDNNEGLWKYVDCTLVSTVEEAYEQFNCDLSARSANSEELNQINSQYKTNFV